MKKTGFIFTMLLLLALAACQPAPAETPTPTPEIVLPPTATNPPIPEPTKTSKPTMTPSITSSPIPTLEETEAIAFTENLLKNNNGCDFPCWWGIIPGKTTWEEAKNFLQPFVLKIEDRSNGAQESFLVVAPVSETIRSNGGLPFGVTVNNKDNEQIVQEISIHRGYQSEISSVLLKYGEPDQIWFWTNGPSIYNEGYLFLFYQNQGMAFYYFGDTPLWGNGENTGYFEVCTNELNKLGPSILLWNPSNSKDFSSIIDDWIFYLSDKNIKELDQISNLSVHNFYSSIVNGTNTDDFCFESDIEYWDSN